MLQREETSDALSFCDLPSIKLPRTCAFVPNNFVGYHDPDTNTSYYAIMHGLEVWIVKHPEPSKSVSLIKSLSKGEPLIQLRKIPCDTVENISCVSWLKTSSDILFAMGTQSGKIYFYDFDAKKLLFSHTIEFDKKIQHNVAPTVNCLASNHSNKIFVGLSNGLLLSFELNQQTTSLQAKKIIYNCHENADWSSLNSDNDVITRNNAMSQSGLEALIGAPIDLAAAGLAPSKNNKNASPNENSAHAITCLRFDKNMNGDGKLYTGLDNGNILLYDCSSGKLQFVVDQQWNPHNVPATCMEICDSFVVAGYATGFIVIIQTSGVSTQIKKVCLHRRAVTGVAIHPKFHSIATVSEDCCLHVLQNDAQLKLLRSLSFENTTLIGVRFTFDDQDEQKPEFANLMLTAYDRNRITFV